MKTYTSVLFVNEKQRYIVRHARKIKLKSLHKSILLSWEPLKQLVKCQSNKDKGNWPGLHE